MKVAGAEERGEKSLNRKVKAAAAAATGAS